MVTPTVSSCIDESGVAPSKFRVEYLAGQARSWPYRSNTMMRLGRCYEVIDIQ